MCQIKPRILDEVKRALKDHYAPGIAADFSKFVAENERDPLLAVARIGKCFRDRCIIQVVREAFERVVFSEPSFSLYQAMNASGKVLPLKTKVKVGNSIKKGKRCHLGGHDGAIWWTGGLGRFSYSPIESIGGQNPINGDVYAIDFQKMEEW